MSHGRTSARSLYPSEGNRLSVRPILAVHARSAILSICAGTHRGRRSFESLGGANAEHVLPVRAPGRLGFGSLLEATRGGSQAIQLQSGEERRFLEDGDEIILRARARRTVSLRWVFAIVAESSRRRPLSGYAPTPDLISCSGLPSDMPNSKARLPGRPSLGPKAEWLLRVSGAVNKDTQKPVPCIMRAPAACSGVNRRGSSAEVAISDFRLGGAAVGLK
jgi:hypothetical protein